MCFVDDNSIMFKLENLKYDSQMDKKLESSKKYLEVWQRLVYIYIYISMGQLEHTKSSYTMMAWKLKDGKETLCTIHDAPGTLSLRSGKY